MKIFSNIIKAHNQIKITSEYLMLHKSKQNYLLLKLISRGLIIKNMKNSSWNYEIVIIINKNKSNTLLGKKIKGYKIDKSNNFNLRYKIYIKIKI
jgi:hypothetical protein